MPISGKNDNTSKNFGPHEDEKSILKEQDIEKDYRILVNISLNTRNHVKHGFSGRTLQDGFLINELSSSLIKVWFSK